jgi:hypothetical protein
MEYLDATASWPFFSTVATAILTPSIFIVQPLRAVNWRRLNGLIDRLVGFCGSSLDELTGQERVIHFFGFKTIYSSWPSSCGT